MQRELRIRRSLALLLMAAVILSLGYHADVPGLFAYALERGKLQADVDHLTALKSADVADLERISHAFSVIARAVQPSVVNVESRSTLEISDDDLRRLFSERGIQVPPSRGIGSGIILDEEGHIVTNNHVVAEAEVIEVTLADGRAFRATLVGTDPKTDLAVIRIDADGLHPARLGDSDQVEVGNLVLAIGSPFRLGHSVSHGIISALGRTNVAVNIDYQNWIQTDAPINPGNSGGPLINTRGEVIGINTAIASDSGSHQGVGFAIPSNTVARIAAVLRTGGAIKRGYLGVVIQPVSPKIADAYGLDDPAGVLVGGVGPKTPAEQAGLQAEDIILAIDGRKIETREQLQEVVASTAPDTVVEMTIWRKGARQQLKVKIGLQPKDFSTTGSIGDLNDWLGEDADKPDAAAEPAKTPETTTKAADAKEGAVSDEERDKSRDARAEIRFDRLGFAVRTLTESLRSQQRIARGVREGAVVTSVSPTGEAYAANLRPGLVIVEANGEPVASAHDLHRVLTDEAIAVGVRIKVKDGRQSTFYTVLRVR